MTGCPATRIGLDNRVLIIHVEKGIIFVMHTELTSNGPELEFEPGMLDFLEEHSLQPGHTGVLTVISPDGTATVEMDGSHVGVPAFATQRILVTS